MSELLRDAGAPATSADEDLVFIPTQGAELFAVVTRPTVPANGRAAIIFSGGQWVTTVGTNRFYVHLARRLAAAGWHAVRFDYLGVGESSGHARPYDSDRPFVDDGVSVAAWLAQQGVHRYLLLGSCYGGRTALAVANRLDGVDGVGMFPPVVRSYKHGERVASLPASVLVRRVLRRRTFRALRSPTERARYAKAARTKLRNLRSRGASDRNRIGAEGANGQAFQWASPVFIEELTKNLARRVPALFVFGDQEDYWNDFRQARAGELGRVIERAGELVTVEVVPGRAHGLQTVAVQEEIDRVLTTWIDDRLDGLDAGLVEPVR